jgi:chromate transporter
MVGDRFFGWRGAAAALGGMMAAPLAIVLALALLHARFAELPAVAAALRGMGAVSAGLLIGMALRLLPGLRAGRAGWAFVAAAFVGAGVLRWPLLGVMGALGSASVALAWQRLARPPQPSPPAPKPPASGAGT